MPFLACRFNEKANIHNLNLLSIYYNQSVILTIPNNDIH